MDWVKTFYSAQNDWMGVYLTPLEERDQERVALVHELVGTKPRRILELGAGGGQTAVALALAGHTVSMVELLAASAQHAQQLAVEHGVALTVHQADFYELRLPRAFDLVVYWDSFGIGQDADQRRLLQRVAQEWLVEGGQALIEVGSPWYWGGVANGQQVDLGDCWRQYLFDVQESRLLDYWWRKTDPATVVHQSLRCYHPADLRLLIEGTGMALRQVRSGGAIVYEPELEWIKKVPLGEAMTYYALMNVM